MIPKYIFKKSFSFLNFEVLSDIGLFLEEFRKDSTQNLFNSKEIYQLSQPEGRVTRLFITIGRENLIVKRFYPKLQEITGSIGGFIQVMSIIALIISNFFNKFKIGQEMIQEIFFEPYETSSSRNSKLLGRISNNPNNNRPRESEENKVINNVKVHSNVSNSEMIKNKENKVFANETDKNCEMGNIYNKMNIFRAQSLESPEPPQLLNNNENINEFLYYHLGLKEIFGIYFCCCFKFYRRAKKIHNKYTKSLHKYADYDKVIRDVIILKRKIS